MLEVSNRRAQSIADVLELTVSRSTRVFRRRARRADRTQTACRRRTRYLRLGQPVPTLSGGEAQRLKLAGISRKPRARPAPEQARPSPALRRSRRLTTTRRGTLFLFDEPTTGLHFDDVAKLLRAFRQLIDAGNSLVVIEHNLDVIARLPTGSSTSVPKAATRAAQIVRTACPNDVMRTRGFAYRQGVASKHMQPRSPSPPWRHHRSESGPAPTGHPRRLRTSIQIHNAREHNLRTSMSRSRATNSPSSPASRARVSRRSHSTSCSPKASAVIWNR